MPYSIKFSPHAAKQFAKLDKGTQRQVSNYLDKIQDVESPYDLGKSLMGNLSGLWRYRVGKYRIICEIRDNELIIEVITIAKRDTVYK